MVNTQFTALNTIPSLLGESPVWHPVEQVLYWCDIIGKKLNRYDVNSEQYQSWDLSSEPGCCAAVEGGGVLVALRNELVFFDIATQKLQSICPAPYDTRYVRFNDGKVDAAGRFWVGTVYEPKDQPLAQLYYLNQGKWVLAQTAGITSNGLAWNLKGDVMYWADTQAHCIYQFDYNPTNAGLGAARHIFKQFDVKTAQTDMQTYQGRPDGATVDNQGDYWVAMFEGSCLLQLSAQGEIKNKWPVPVYCPTMPTFGGADYKTLFVTTSQAHRSATELLATPCAGQVLMLPSPVQGVPAQLVKRQHLGLPQTNLWF